MWGVVGPAVLALGLIGGVLGLVLWYASRRFFVITDDKVEEIIAVLPGINCGGCSFPGCAGYAAAVAAGKAPVTACAPGGPVVAKALAELMGMAAPALAARPVAVCTCQKKGVAVKADYQGIWQCRAADMAALSGGPMDCKYGCLGFGDCLRHCPTGALTQGPIDAGRPIVVDEAACIGCRRCVAACPRHLMQVMPMDHPIVVSCHNQDYGVIANRTCAHACITCRKCEKACPYEAIIIKNALSCIDYGKCRHCGACVKACPKQCIRDLGKERATACATPEARAQA